MSPDDRPGDFSEPMTWPRYTGIPTFMCTPCAEDLDGVHVGLIGVPFDAVEVAPPFDPSGNAALVGATTMFEIPCVVAQARAAVAPDGPEQG